MALHKQVKKKKQYPTNWTLFPGYNDKFLIHYDSVSKCFRVTHYSRFGEQGKIKFMGLAKTDSSKPWRRISWTYQKQFENEIGALRFAKQKAKDRKMDVKSTVFLLELDGGVEV